MHDREHDFCLWLSGLLEGRVGGRSADLLARIEARLRDALAPPADAPAASDKPVPGFPRLCAADD